MSRHGGQLVLGMIVVVFLAVGGARASEPLLILSGGGEPRSNAVNHLDNVRWVRSVWADRGPVWSLVADGRNPAPDVARSAPVVAEIDRWLQRLIMGTGAPLAFADSKEPSIVGPATRAGLESWITHQGQQLQAGQLLTVYVTDHGVRGTTSEGIRESQIVLWGEDLGATEFARMLDGLPDGVGVRLVMAQCYSGGFTETVADLLHVGRSACGFFSTLADRVAAGCRIDPRASGYAEYSTVFFSAYTGRPRPDAFYGDPPPAAVGNARLAHAQAGVELTGVDVPNMSSDWFGGASSDPVTGPLQSVMTQIAAAAPNDAPTPQTAAERLDTALGQLYDIEDRMAVQVLQRFPWLEYPFAAGFSMQLRRNRAKIESYLDGMALKNAWEQASKQYAQAAELQERLEAGEARKLRAKLAQRRLTERAPLRRLPQDQWIRMQACERGTVLLSADTDQTKP